MLQSLRTQLLAFILLAISTVANVQAGFVGVTFFGDSISDTGNVLSLTTILQPPPFPDFPGAPGRFSNGPVWTETFAAALGFPTASNPSNLIFNGSSVVPIGLLGGQNFSFGGARTGLGGSGVATSGLLGQLLARNGTAFSGALTRAADPNGLYVIMAGMNDMRDFSSGSAGASTPSQAAFNVINAVNLLAQAGAQHFLISNVTDLGKTPEASLLGRVSESTAASLEFNAALAAGLGILDASFLVATGIDLDIRSLDLFGLSESIFDDALNHGGTQFGITNVTTPCIIPGPISNQYFAPDAVAVACNVAAFSDPLHPSSVVHRLIGDAAAEAVGLVQISEPGTVAILGIGLMGMILSRRRTRGTP